MRAIRGRSRSRAAGRRLTFSVAWLAVMAMASPGAPVADSPPVAPQQPAGGDPQLADPAQPEDGGERHAPEAPPAGDPAEPPGDLGAQPSAAPPDPPDAAAEGAAAGSRPRAAAASPAPATRPVRPRAVAAADGSVTIRDFSFGPATVTVGVGDSVTWRNGGPSSHTATATDGGFDTGLLSEGESGTATFDEAGTFSYLCEPHPSMRGTVRVVAQASGDRVDGDGTAGSGDADGSSDPDDTGAAPDSGEELPSTGAEPGWLVLTGLGLLLIGLSGTRAAARRARR
jgi:LPXTG-motif cell wall-anchored protein